MLFKKFLILILLCQFLMIGEIFSQQRNAQKNSLARNTKRYSYKNSHKKKKRSVKKSTSAAKTETEISNTNQPTLAVQTEPIATPTPAPTPVPLVNIAVNDDMTDPERVEVNKNENLGDDVQGGNVVVKVTSNGNASVKIGLAQRGVTVVEFPAGDPVYKIFPGDENFVTVDCGARDKENRCLNSPTDSIVLRPGKMFSQWGTADEDTATVVTVQRASGIVVSFIVLPVRKISQHAFHVVVRYDLAEVIAQRRSAGLPFNLDKVGEIGNKPNQIPSGVQYDAKNANSAPSLIQNAVFQNDMPLEESQNETDLEADLEERTLAELKKVAKSADRLYFSKPVHGLSLAVATQDSRTSDYVIEVIAVRNMNNKPLRLVPEQPEIFVDSANSQDKNQSVTSERLTILMQATTADENDVLLPNQTYYFAFAYKMPILGAKQVLKVGFAGREAADEPASAILLGLTRSK